MKVKEWPEGLVKECCELEIMVKKQLKERLLLTPEGKHTEVITEKLEDIIKQALICIRKLTI